jgi:hypothetical protein
VLAPGLLRLGHHLGVSEEIDLAAKTSAEVVSALAEASGALGPSQELWGAITSGIHYHFYPRVVRQALAAAEKIRGLDIPQRAYAEIPDKLLKAILEGGATEDDEGMQERWANLLANAIAKSPARVRLAFPRILLEIEPSEAAALDLLYEDDPPFRTLIRDLDTRISIFAEGLDNLVRLEVLRYTRDEGNLGGAPEGVESTDLGAEFVSACREPQRRKPWLESL